MYINNQAMENLTQNVDWVETIQELKRTNSSSYETLLDLLFSSVRPVYKTEQSDNVTKTLHSRLKQTYDFVVSAVNHTVDGRCTDNSKISAIKALRTEFDMDLKRAKDSVEKMMELYANNRKWIPEFSYDNYGNYVFH
jgi:hypothetical protein